MPAIRASTIHVDRGQPDRSVWYSGFALTFLVTSEETGGQFSLVEEVARRGVSANPPLHLQTREEESFYIMDGEVTFEVDGEILHASAGSFVMIPRGVPHRFKIESEEVRMLNLCTPGGFEGFFRDMSEPLPSAAVSAVPDGLPDLEKVVATAAKYGVEVIGPPLP